MGNTGSEERNGVPLDREESSEVHRRARAQQSRSDATMSRRLKRWQGKSDKHVRREARPFQRDPPVGESQSNGIIERAVGLVAGQARTLKAALEHRIGTRIPPDARILCWLVATERHRCRGCTAEGTTHPSWNSERRFCTCQPNQQQEESGNRDSIPECSWGC